MEIMEKANSVYENLIGVTNEYRFENGSIKDCMLNQKNIISTKYGDLIPKYGAEEVGTALHFHFMRVERLRVFL